MTYGEAMTQPKPSAQALADARKSAVSHHPATAELCESWSVASPRGADVHYQSPGAARDAAETGIY